MVLDLSISFDLISLVNCIVIPSLGVVFACGFAADQCNSAQAELSQVSVNAERD
jgi:hypothetical protein